MARGLKFRIKVDEGLYYPCSENKGADQFAVTAKLICAFVFAYAKSRFSHDEAQMKSGKKRGCNITRFSGNLCPVCITINLFI